MNTMLLGGVLFAVSALCICFFWFEKKKPSLPILLIVATLCAIGASGRVLFNFLPQIQPVTALVMIAGVSVGGKGGFLVGALSALASNLVLGQGPWTPWQMLAWGIIGLLAGLLGRTRMKENLFFVCVLSFLSGLLFSIIMDCYTVLSIGSQLTWPMAFAAFGAGLLFNLSHAVGNVVFILLLYRPMRKKIDRIKGKYGIY